MLWSSSVHISYSHYVPTGTIHVPRATMTPPNLALSIWDITHWFLLLSNPPRNITTSLLVNAIVSDILDTQHCPSSAAESCFGYFLLLLIPPPSKSVSVVLIYLSSFFSYKQYLLILSLLHLTLYERLQLSYLFLSSSPQPSISRLLLSFENVV